MADAQARPKLLLVDGTAYLYRAHHVHTSLSDRSGRPTGAIYGTVNILQKQRRRIDPEYVAVVMDAPGKNFRHALYPEYKAHRKPMPPELKAQIEPLQDIIKALGLPLLVVPEVEADDVIGTLARQGEADGMEVAILSGDKDLAQLVTERITLHDIDREPLGVEGVVGKFQVRPDQIVDYLALAGDASDNIPGVPKAGPKTVSCWLREYGTLDNLMANAAQISGKIGDNLRASLEVLPLYRQLTTVRCDVALDRALRDLRPGPEDTVRLEALYAEYGMNSFLRELRARADADAAVPESAPDEPQTRDYAPILELEELEAWLQAARQAGAFALDTETTGLDPQTAELVGVSLAVAPGRAAYIPLGHRGLNQARQLEREPVFERLQPLLNDPKLTKIGHHLKYDRAVLRRCGLELAGPCHDSMLESYVYNSTASRHNLDDLSRVYLNEETIRFGEVAGTGKKQVSFDQVPIETATPYAAEDADMTLRLHHYLWPRLRQSATQARLYQELELPLSGVLAEMERVGVAIDAAALHAQSQALREELAQLKEDIARECGGEINLNSTRDLQRVLFEERQLKTGRKTPGGSASTAEDVLKELAAQDILPRMILEYRQRTKLLSTYIDKLPKMINPATGRVHTSYHQAVTATGRLSSSDPNLQNIPIRTEAGRRIRQAFVGRDGCVLIAADYSQIELRIMAHISQDPALCRAFEEGADVHRATAAEVFGIAHEAVTPEQRRAAKAINFGLMYGMSAFGLARQLDIPRAQAEAYMTTYFERYPQVRAYMERTREQARQDRYVETVHGRRLHLEAIRSRNYNQRQYAERTAINAPMQGTAADIIKQAMIEVHAWLQQAHPDCALILQVHDELVLEAPRAKAEEVARGVCAKMEHSAELSVPLVVEAGCGENWDQAH